VSVWEGLKLAWKGLVANKIRSVLTMLGIIFGVGAVIAMISVGQGAAKDVSARIEGMGSNLIVISPIRNTGARFFLDDVVELAERIPTISEAIPSLIFSATIKWGTSTYETNVEGVTDNYPSVRNAAVEKGRFINSMEVENRTRTVILGKTVVKELFKNQDPLGQTVTINGQPFLVAGIMEAKGATLGRDQDDVAFIPVSVAERLAGTREISTIYAKLIDPDMAPLAVGHIQKIFEHKFGRPGTIRVTSQDQLLSTVSSTAQTFTLMLGAIAGISLLVGGIGIMNIMLVSVTERFREIGIRKALGALHRDIIFQFLVESVFLSISGGIIGVFLGIGLSYLITLAVGWTTALSSWAIIVSFTFALAVGLFFGIYPAVKAANLDPIVALRRE